MKIGIIGLGLMGGSFSYDIKELYPTAEISGFDISKENITVASELGIINSLFDIEKISDYIIKLIDDLDDNGKLKFKKTKDENSRMSPKFSVTLGVMPDYLFDGKGMKIDGVSSDKPAEKGGILKGDIVIKID